MKLNDYALDGFFDEMFAAPARPRPGSKLLAETLETVPTPELLQRQRAAELSLLQLGITFNVYGDRRGTERIWPFDIIPRVVSGKEWTGVEKGLRQRIRALNMFIDDVYHDQKIVKDGVIPADIITSASSYRPVCKGLNPPGGVWCHITGTDLVRDGSGKFMVLEDNLRCPSGVSYVLENRRIMKNTFPQVFENTRVRPVVDYPGRLLALLQGLAPDRARPRVAVLTPGIYNSAYFEHSFLAQQMGVYLVEGRDLFLKDGFVHMRTTRGSERVDVLYRRIDDDFIDPAAFRPDSMLGVKGLMEAYRKGNIALANAPGTGVADDKVVYAYVPEMIKYYLSEDAILPNVDTFLCWRPADQQHVLANLDKLVVKAANESGGYGMLIGPHSTKAQQDEFAAKIKANPRNYIAQPTLDLSRAPVIIGDTLEGRHVDLRPFILHQKEETFVLPGGLTRVALKKGSLVVNSSQGGGSKDTWVLADDAAEAETAAPSGRDVAC
jgi:uncharacterized circularly permuted ATP-grasp superfamily protein